MNESSIKAFIIPHEAWYKEIIKEPPYITIGLCYESGGTEAEFKIAWEDLGIRLLAFDDSWKVLGKMPELIELLAGISKKRIRPTVKQFAEMLEDIGFKDITERERKDDRRKQIDRRIKTKWIDFGQRARKRNS